MGGLSVKLVVALVALSLASSGAAPTAIPSEAYSHPQRLVVVDGKRRLNVFCQGQGAPMVLFDAGLGDSTMSWRYVQGEVAKGTRVCSYDRAGLGFSDAPPGASDVTSNVEDIHRLLKALKADGPIVYVGHSIAGLYGVTLQGKYPGDVAAEVLVDPSFADQAEKTADAYYWPSARPIADDEPPPWSQQMVRCLALAKSGALRTPKTEEAKACVSVDPSLDPVLKRVKELQRADPKVISATISEDASFLPSGPDLTSVDRVQVEAANAQFDDKPLIILTAGNMPSLPDTDPAQARVNDAVMAGHERLAALSTRGSHIVVPDSQHYIQIDQPKAVITAVEKAVAAVRNKP